MLLFHWLRALKSGWIRGHFSRRAEPATFPYKRPRGQRMATSPELLEVRQVLAQDFGDAPDTGAGTGTANYETLLANNGPRHTIVAGLKLGAIVDSEADASPNVAANGDVLDEDGVLIPQVDLLFTLGASHSVTLLATNTTGAAATLYGWVDTNGNGVFDNATERASVVVPDGTTNGRFTLNFPTITTTFTGTTYARFRLSTDIAAANSTGAASDGEVEDYAVEITKPTAGTVKTGGITLIGSGTNGGPTLADRDQFGRSVAAIGDIDGDGVIDLVVGAHQDDTGLDEAGAAYVLRMNADGTVKASTKIAHNTGGGPTLVINDVFGTSVAGIGDIDRDGIPDIAVGAIGDDTVAIRSGAVYLFRLNADGTVKTGGTTKLASGLNSVPTLAGGGQFGTSVAAIGDVDGDGVSDLAVGAFGQDSYRGGVYVLLMNPDGTVKSSSRIANGVGGGPTLASSDLFGISVAPLGDIDGDGLVDLAVGASGDDTGGNSRGAVYIVRLLADGTAKSTTKIASGLSGGPSLINFSDFGGSLAQAGDLDGNGVNDLVVGSPDRTGNPTEIVYVLFLKSDGTSAGATAIGNNLGGGPALGNVTFGGSVAALGDFDGDGVVDFAAGTPNEAIGGYSRGAIRILRLNTPTLDFGDAPDTAVGTGTGNYATYLGDNGPRHTVVSGLKLGAGVDAESVGRPNTTANGDDTGTDDEDGVVNPLTDLRFTIGTRPKITFRATNTTLNTAFFSGWIDYNSDGVFDSATEQASVTVLAGTNNGTSTLTFPTVPAGFTGTTFARFRLSTDPAAINPTGPATDGEVEDYAVTIVSPSNGKVKPNGVVRIADGENGGPTLPGNDGFGRGVASLGDIDNDGIGDIAVADDLDDTGGMSRGAVYVLRLNADGSVKTGGLTKIAHETGGGPTLANQAYFGSTVTGLGDIDGDGIGDLAVGTAGEDGLRGAVYILRLNADGTVKTGGTTRIASGVNGGPTLNSFDLFGVAVAAIGDFDGDGTGDLVVGAKFDDAGLGANSNFGAVYILRLNPDGTVKTGGVTKIGDQIGGGPDVGTYDYFGQSVAALGDIDGDGIVDLAVGAAGDNTGGNNRGAVYILRLNPDGTVKTGGVTKIASGIGGGPALNNDDVFSRGLASPGDVNGDGIPDLAVGAWADDTGGPERGAVYILRLNADGTAQSTLTTKIASGLNGGPTDANQAAFGGSIAPLGDRDGDGFADLLVGAYGNFNVADGAAYLIHLDGPKAPTALALGTSSIAENQPVGTAIGSFTTTDPNTGDTFTYTLATGTGDTDNASFQIVGNELRSNGVFDFETKSSYSIRVRTTDDSMLFFERTFTISVNDVNEAPTVALQNTTTTLPENTSTTSALKLADIVVTDDALGTNTLSLTGPDAAFFEIVGTELRLNANTVLSAFAKSTYNVTVAVDDATVGASPDASVPFTLTVTETPSLVVTTTTDVVSNTDGLTSLREAITFANSNPDVSVITFGDGSMLGGTNFTDTTPDTILLTGGELAITTSLTITGNGAANTIIDGGWDGIDNSGIGSRIFRIDDGMMTVQIVSMTGLTLQKAHTGTGNTSFNGGAIRNSEQLTLSDSVVRDHFANEGVGVFNEGTLVSSRTTYSGNRGSRGGGIFNSGGTLVSTGDAFTGNVVDVGGGIFASGSTTLINATIANNTASAGGGIFSQSNITTINTTIANNTANTGAGFFAQLSICVWDAKNTIVAGNSGGDVRLNGLPVITGDRLLIGDNTLSGTGITSNVTYAAIFGTNVLANNGGATQTIALAAGSVAINAGKNTLALDANNDPLTTDQRGTGFARILGGIVDIGAFESTNSPPTNVTLTSNSIAENAGANAIIGALAGVDPDPRDQLTLSLPTGLDDNALFNLDSGNLRANSSFNFEAKSTYTVTVRVTDFDGLTFDRQFTINVTDVNEAPTAVALQNTTTSLAENTSTTTAIKLADIVVTDDALGTNTLSLTGPDAASFEIVGTELRLKSGTVLDFETKSTYSVTINVDDTTLGATPDLTTPFTLTITDVNEAPTAVALQNTTTTLPENTSTTSAIKLADIVVTDDALGTNTLSLTGTDAAFFEIVGTELRLKSGTVLDFEAKSSYSVTVNVDDATVGATPDASTNFTLTVTDVNEAPTGLALSNAQLPENQPVGFAIGTFSSTDPNPNETFTYTLVSGTGDTDNASFQIVGNELRSMVVFDFETKSSHAIRVRTTNGAGLSFEKTFTVTIANIGEIPVNLSLSATRLTELVPAGTFVGNLSATDPNSAGAITFAIVNGSSLPLTIRNGHELVTTAPIDVKQTPLLDVTIRATSVGGESTESTFRLQIDEVVRAFRAYNTSVHTHFFTTNFDEFRIAVNAGYRDEATGNNGFAILLAPDIPSAAPLYRIYNLATGRHYYTMNRGEVDALVAVFPPPASGPDTRRNGWRDEGIVGYIFDTPQPGTIEVFRLYNTFSGGHLFAVDPAERDSALAIVDLRTQQRPWVLHDRVGYAYFSDASRGGSRAASTTAPPASASVTSSSPTTAAASSTTGIDNALLSRIAPTPVAHSAITPPAVSTTEPTPLPELDHAEPDTELSDSFFTNGQLVGHLLSGL